MSKKNTKVVVEEEFVQEYPSTTEEATVASPVLGDVEFDPIVSGQTDAVRNSEAK